jgi:nucleoside-diphosphate-sugar epimerase
MEVLIDGLPDGPEMPSGFGTAPITSAMYGGPIATNQPERIGWRDCDLRSQEDCGALLQGAEGATVFHCAGVIHPRRIREFQEINVEATKNLLEAAAQARVRRVVIVSSNSPIGTSSNNFTVFDEDSPYRPYLNYGLSKMRMEVEARRIADRTGLEVVTVRAPWFYGPKQPVRQNDFFKMIRAGRAPVLGDGENRRSMAYLDNLVNGLVLCAVTPEAASKTYWISDADPYTWNEIISTIETVIERDFGLKCDGGRLNLPRALGKAAYGLDWAIQKIGRYNQKVHVLSEIPTTIACSIDRAKSELGYEPRISLDEGMKRSIQSALDAGVNI